MTVIEWLCKFNPTFLSTARHNSPTLCQKKKREKAQIENSGRWDKNVQQRTQHKDCNVWIHTTSHVPKHSILSTAKPYKAVFILKKVFKRPADCPTAWRASCPIFRQHLPFPCTFLLISVDVWQCPALLWCSSLLSVFPLGLFIVDNLIRVASGNLCVCILLCFCMFQLPDVIWASNFPREHKAPAGATLKCNKTNTNISYPTSS